MKTKWRTDLPEGDACLVGANLLTTDGGGLVRVGNFRFNTDDKNRRLYQYE